MLSIDLDARFAMATFVIFRLCLLLELCLIDSSLHELWQTLSDLDRSEFLWASQQNDNKLEMHLTDDDEQKMICV